MMEVKKMRAGDLVTVGKAGTNMVLAVNRGRGSARAGSGGVWHGPNRGRGHSSRKRSPKTQPDQVKAAI
jgi:hypothetical protein